MKLRILIIGLLGFGIVIVLLTRGCESPANKGEALYQSKCANCHGENGKGFSIYPPLANSDYFLENKDEFACIVYYGIEGEITVNGQKYSQRMLGDPTLSATQIANLMNYVYGRWGNKKVEVNSEDIENRLNNCDSELVK
ncbi:cytochrome c [Salibacter sp.]|uniref:c-type cytochrome n=1 Tax=Salibacter sp. TaxID=2010995 RepID=UPI0028701EA8|nr:cytochrome c [Salibacter sp.]MDR9398239.1 cytochrome c [Salibacter sp.]MDR9487457.1 cytochrome c [Salibacter sp.]